MTLKEFYDATEKLCDSIRRDSEIQSLLSRLCHELNMSFDEVAVHSEAPSIDSEQSFS